MFPGKLSRQWEETSCPEAALLPSPSGGSHLRETSGIPLRSFYQKHVFLILQGARHHCHSSASTMLSLPLLPMMASASGEGPKKEELG